MLRTQVAVCSDVMQPSLDQLIQITRTLTHDYDFVRVGLASTQGDTPDDTRPPSSSSRSQTALSSALS